MDNKNNFISENLKVEKLQDIIIQNIKGGIIIFNTKNENYLGLDEVGARFWNVLLHSNSIKAAYDKILDEHEVAPDVFKDNLDQFFMNC